MATTPWGEASSSYNNIPVRDGSGKEAVVNLDRVGGTME